MNLLIKNTIAIVLTLFLLVSCTDENEKNLEVVEREDQPSVYMVEDEDVNMNLAIKDARDSVNVFIIQLQNPTESQTYFSVKAQYVDGNESEHIWLSEVQFDGNKFIGKIGNEPLNVSNISFGDPTSVQPESISDWMIIENNKMLGGYTIRVLRNTMTEAEKTEFDKSFPYIIE